jgi:LPXTG-motif cell wall-anchored protein
MNLMHKAVRELPNTSGKGEFIFPVIMATLVLLSIVLIFLNKKAGLIIGLIPSGFLMIQWIITHVLQGKPDINGIWWYPLLPFFIGALTCYFTMRSLQTTE